MIKRFLFFTTWVILLGSGTVCGQRLIRLTNSVDPFIGTGGHGHTYPGASFPFGMVQVSPDTRLEGWDGCSGYHATDDTIFGFSHTHLSGTGCSDYGDILLMPVDGDVSLEGYGYASPFNPASEKASPGYYRVGLSTYDIGVELTATKRTGFHRYTYPGTDSPSVVLDLAHRDHVLASGLAISNDREVEGYRFSEAWAKDQRVYFVIRFSRPFKDVRISSDGEFREGIEEVQGTDLKAWFGFQPMNQGEELLVKVGISAVSIEGARNNLETENPGWDFDISLEACRLAWTRELEKITVAGGSKSDQTVFYTALYHALLSPNLYMDCDGKYLGRDLNVHKAEGFDYYTVFSLWDTYRALHPLLTIIDQKRTNDFIQTFIRQYREGGLLPVWELSANETNCMIGYHAVPVIADAYLKGIRDYPAEEAFEAMKNSANQDHAGLSYYKQQGFIPGDMESESVSRTLEYAYDDWCIAQMAGAMGKEGDYLDFIRRAQYYKNLYDPTTGFMRAKINNRWFSPFDPYEVNFNYTEANAWQYSFYIPQDIQGMMHLMGGKEHFVKKLDELFSARTLTTGRDQADITGLIGQYAQGNEPSHHMAYLYDFAGQPWKTQELVHRIMQDFYSDSRDGLCGNEDCGQMSAWYIFSALGFYPVTPGSGYYAIGTPKFPLAKIELENGKSFTIIANNLSHDNFYIQSCSLNGKSHETSLITHEEIMDGGELVFEMGNTPNFSWGMITPEPGYEITDHLIQPVPYIAEGESTFFDSTLISIASPDPEEILFYKVVTNHSHTGQINESEATAREDVTDPADPASDARPPDPDMDFQIYTGPFTVAGTTTLLAYAQNKGGERSFTIESLFQKIPENRKIDLLTRYTPAYSAGGDLALVDFRKGGVNFKTGLWQGYEGVDLDAVVDLGELQPVNRISVGFLQDVGSWIFFPTEVEFFVSVDGKSFSSVGVSIHEFSQKDYEPRTLEQWVDLDPALQARYIKVVAKSQAICPEWHPGAGKKCWIFADEITVD